VRRQGAATGRLLTLQRVLGRRRMVGVTGHHAAELVTTGSSPDVTTIRPHHGGKFASLRAVWVCSKADPMRLLHRWAVA